jgi:hypothetical protein
MGRIVELNLAEQEICKLVAKLRADNNDKNGIEDKKFRDNISNFQTHLEGFGGELAFAKIINVYPDFSIYSRNSVNDNGDLQWNSKSIDVKTTHIPNGRLITPYWKVNSKVNIYVLMVGVFPKYEYKGYLYKEEFIIPNRLKNLGYGNTYVAEQRDLRID